MNTSLDEHVEFDELAAGWALYSLEPEDEAHFAAHLPACRRCRASVAQSTSVLADLADALPDDRPPTPQLRDRIRCAITYDLQPPSLRPAMPSPVRASTLALAPNVPTSRRRWKVMAAVAALIAFTAGVGGWNVVVHADRSREAGLAQRYAIAIRDVTRPGAAKAELTAPGGTPVATVVLHDDTVSVVTMHIAQNEPRTSTYVLWGIDPGRGRPRAIGGFDVTQPGINDRPVHLIGPRKQYVAYAVSRESARHTPDRPSAIIARGQTS